MSDFAIDEAPEVDGAAAATMLVLHLATQDRVVLQALMDHRDSASCVAINKAEHSLREMVCAWTGYGKSSVYGSLQRLKALGLIRIVSLPAVDGRVAGERCVVIPGIYAEDMVFRSVMSIKPDFGAIPDDQMHTLLGFVKLLQKSFDAWSWKMTNTL